MNDFISEKNNLEKLIEDYNQDYRKNQGIYYTPQYIIDIIIKETIFPLLKNHEKYYLNLKILDPACGSGLFLTKAFDFLYENITLIEKDAGIKTNCQGIYYSKIDILKNNLFGLDLDKKAIDITKINLQLKIKDHKRKILEELNNHIRQGNYLIDEAKIDAKYFLWEGDFEEGTFDCVIGNPPYVFTREREFLDREKQFYKKKYLNLVNLKEKNNAIQSGKYNLFALFLIKSIIMLKENGILGFILPNTLLRVNTYIFLRKFILDRCKILKIIDAGPDVFKNATVSTCILILEKNENVIFRNSNDICISKLDSQNIEKSITSIKQTNFLNNQNYVFNLFTDESYYEIISLIEKNSIPLGDIVNILNGIATGKDKNNFISEYKLNDNFKPLIEGKDIGRFNFEFKNRYIEYDRSKLHRARDENLFLAPNKIIMQRITSGSNVLIGALDTEQFYTFNSVNNLIMKRDDYSIKYILALLNSRLMNWYYVAKFSNKSKLTVNISKTNLEQLPVKKIDIQEEKQMEKYIDSIIDLSKEKGSIDQKYKSKLLEIITRIKMIEEKINTEIFKIYGINEEKKNLLFNF